MARKVVLLLLIVLTGAGLGFAWYQSADSQPADSAAMSASAKTSAPVPAMVPSQDALSNQSAEPAALEHDPLSQRSAVGLPFELSASVRANCQLFPGACTELLQFLERMGAEPRTEIWARDMEARIEKAVMSGERGKFRIRALECRSTRCALEVASEVDYVGIEFDSDPVFNSIMIPRPGYFANENDAQTGITTLVSSQVWQTSESFDAEQAVTD